MPAVPVVVVGAGPAGLAVSRLLAERGVDHIVLERGRTAESWRSRRWDSLRLLSPNWATRLPGLQQPADPDGFLTAAALVDVLDRYAADGAAPLVEHAEVISVRPYDARYRVVSTAGTWTADAVVLATGDAAVPAVPDVATDLPRHLHQLSSDAYRNPRAVPDGGVLVVGASASGVQIADELSASGRDVVLAVGRHTRMIRTYRGMDVYWWLDRLGSLDRHVDDVRDRAAVLGEPSLQLVGRGRPDGTGTHDVSLPALASRGVRLTGRLTGIASGRAHLADDLPRTTAAADAQLTRLLRRIDAHVAATGLADEVLPPTAPPSPTPVPPHVSAVALTSGALTSGALTSGAIATVLWATGYRRSYPWLHVPVLDTAGEVVHRHGVTPSPGLFVVGQRWQTRRSSAFLAGMGEDARYVVTQLVRRLPGAPRPTPTPAAHLSRQECLS